MMKEELAKEFNKQINEELFSEYLYLSMAAYYYDNNLKGFAHWFMIQAKEERKHAMKFFDHLIERGVRVELLPIQQPRKEWASPLEAEEDAYKHECHITSRINFLLDLAYKEKDYAAIEMLNWFAKEQVEEEANASEILAHLKKIKEHYGGLMQLDHNLGKRKEE
ncbi:MAG: ferritin [Thermoplasmata archaeon]